LRVTSPMHSPSQADYLDNSSMQNTVFPPAPTPSMNMSMPSMQNSQQSKPQFPAQSIGMMDSGPMPANSFGGKFGSF